MVWIRYRYPIHRVSDAEKLALLRIEFLLRQNAIVKQAFQAADLLNDRNDLALRRCGLFCAEV